MILNFYERDQSPWVWVRYGTTGQTPEYTKTKIRKDDPDKAHKIVKARLKIEIMLHERTGKNPSQNWHWVPKWINTRYGKRGETHRVYINHWKWLSMFIEDEEIASPANFEREHCFEYIGWRTRQVKEKSRKSPSQNSAIGEIKFMHTVMDEALQRGLCSENPCKKLRLEKEEPPMKPEIHDDELQIIYDTLEGKHQWMQRSFFIAFHTALRFETTRIERDQVRWDDNLIVIEKPKGGRSRAFSIPIYDTIRPMLKEWWKTGDRWLWTLPEEAIGGNGSRLTGLLWHKFFKETVKLPHLCFHCTRVSFISRGMRAGIPEALMCKLVNHAKKEINRIYQRWLTSDLRDAVALIPQTAPAPSFSAAKSQSPTGKKAQKR